MRPRLPTNESARIEEGAPYVASYHELHAKLAGVGVGEPVGIPDFAREAAALLESEGVSKMTLDNGVTVERIASGGLSMRTRNLRERMEAPVVEPAEQGD